MKGPSGFWDIEPRLAEPSAEGDPLEKLSAMVDFEIFLAVLAKAVRRSDSAKRFGEGRPSWLRSGAAILHGPPLQQVSAWPRPSELDAVLRPRPRRRAAGCLPLSGRIIDATLVAAPRQRNTDGEKEAIKAGASARDIWPKKPAKAAQKDVDARWTIRFAKARPAPPTERPGSA